MTKIKVDANSFIANNPAMHNFVEFPKIARLSRECIVTEKIDGTNASVFIGDDGEFLTGSRTRWITPQDDNFGFSKWAHDHKEELMKLGPGTHFGEWWGSGIQRGYGLVKGDKRFSLFNVTRWEDASSRPACCHVVPELARARFHSRIIELAMEMLIEKGSLAAPGFMKPEGIVVFHTAGNVGFKKTIDKDDSPKAIQ